MAHIHEPVSECFITITELVVPDDQHGPRTVFNSFRFRTIAELREYFLSKFSVAKSLGYDLKQKPSPGTYNDRVVGRLGFEYKDRFVSSSLEFNSIADFVKFLEDHPPLADVVGYVRRRN
jgi:hypothetical protein